MSKYIRLYIDHPRIGSGFRNVLVLAQGPKWARLLITATGEHIKVPAADLKFATPLPFKLIPTRAAKRLRNVAKTYGVETEAIKDGLAILKEMI